LKYFVLQFEESCKPVGGKTANAILAHPADQGRLARVVDTHVNIFALSLQLITRHV